MTSTAVLTEDTTTIVSDTSRQFHWGAAIAGAIGATATTFFLITLGSGIGLSVVAGAGPHRVAFLTLGAIYVFVAQAFGFAVGGYLVGRLIGPEAETSKEEEFRAAAHGFTVWGLAVVVGLLIAGYTALPRAPAGSQTPSAYWLDVLFRPAPNTPLVASDKAEVSRIWLMDGTQLADVNDNVHIARLVSQDTGLSISEASSRVQSVQAAMQQDIAQKAKAASYLTLWTAFALLFGAVVCVAASISARWMDDKVSFGFARR